MPGFFYVNKMFLYLKILFRKALQDAIEEIEVDIHFCIWFFLFETFCYILPKDYLNDLSTTLCRGGKKGTLHL